MSYGKRNNDAHGPQDAEKDKAPNAISDFIPVWAHIILWLFVMAALSLGPSVYMAVNSTGPIIYHVSKAAGSLSWVLIYLIVRLIAMTIYGWRRGYAMPWSHRLNLNPDQRDRGPHSQNEIIPMGVYLLVQIFLFALLIFIKPVEPHIFIISPLIFGTHPVTAYDAWMYRIAFSAIGAILVPWFVLKIYILARYGWRAARQLHWAADA